MDSIKTEGKLQNNPGGPTRLQAKERIVQRGIVRAVLQGSVLRRHSVNALIRAASKMENP